MMLLRLITKKISSSAVAFGLGSAEKLKEAAVSAGVAAEMVETESRQPKIFSTHKIQLSQHCCELQLKRFPRACSGFI